MLLQLEFKMTNQHPITPPPDLVPSLKEQALKILATAGGPDYPTQMTVINTDEHILIRRALEALPDDIK